MEINTQEIERVYPHTGLWMLSHFTEVQTKTNLDEFLSLSSVFFYFFSLLTFQHLPVEIHQNISELSSNCPTHRASVSRIDFVLYKQDQSTM